MLSDGVIELRPPGEGDLDALHRECQDPEIQRWTGIPSPYMRSDAVAYLERIAEEEAAGRTRAFLAVDGEQVLGSFSVMEMDRRPGYGEIGYWVAARARGRVAGGRPPARLVRGRARAGADRAADPRRQRAVDPRGRADRVHGHRRAAHRAALGGSRSTVLPRVRLEPGVEVERPAGDRVPAVGTFRGGS